MAVIPLPPEGENEAKRLSKTYEFFYNPLLMFAFLVASWWTSYCGVLAMEDWISGIRDETRKLALLVTAGAMGAQFALWHMAMRLIPRYSANSAKSIGVFVLLILMIALGSSSAYCGFIGLAGNSARGLELQDQAKLYAEIARSLARRASATEDALFAIKPQAQTACARYEQELQTGAITGASGKGIVTGHFLRLCTGKSEIVSALEETIASNKQRIEKISSVSRQLDGEIFDRGKPIGERELEFLRLAREIDRLLEQLQNADRSKGLRATTESMAGSVAELDDATGALGHAQAQAVAAIIAEEQAAAKGMSSLLAEIEGLPLPVPGRADLLPAQLLVFKFWALHLPQLGIVGITDCYAPLSLLLFWCAALKARVSKATPHSKGN